MRVSADDVRGLAGKPIAHACGWREQQRQGVSLQGGGGSTLHGALWNAAARLRNPDQLRRAAACVGV